MEISKEKNIEVNDDLICSLKDENQGIPVEGYLDIAECNFSVLRETIRNFGDTTLSEYIGQLEPEIHPVMQTSNDLFEEVVKYLKPLLGKEIAHQAALDLERSPIVLTANHHGVAFFAQDLQGSLIFSLNRFGTMKSGSTVPVFSCGTVPLDNLTYPLGLLFYKTGYDNLDEVPKKLPLFSNKVRRQLVSNARPFDKNMVDRAQKRIGKLSQDKFICSSLEASANNVLQDYCQSKVLNACSYSQQSVLLNYSIWNKLFQDTESAPSILSLELEVISSALLEKDLANANSLAYSIFFDKSLRENVFNELDGEKACWQTKKLLGRLHAGSMSETKRNASNGCGTMLFWGIDERGRKVPLYVDSDSTDRIKLRGICDRGKIMEMPYTPKSIIEGLNQGRLIPSIFTSFLVISLARGIVCAGGYFQCEYLPAMQHGVVKALNDTGGYDVVAQQVSKVTTNAYLSGMIGVMTRYNGDYLVPAGPLEILSSGGFENDDIEKLQSLSVKNAHIGALSETLQDLPFWTAMNPGWRSEIASGVKGLLENKVVIK